MNSINTVSDVYGPDTTIFAKYPEAKDLIEGGVPFKEGGYGPHVMHSEEARLLPVLGGETSHIVHESAQALFGYYSAKYPETFCPDNLMFYRGMEYYDLIEKLKDRSLAVLHPYARISDEKYQVNPEVLFRLNNKQYIHELSEHTPAQQFLSLEEISAIDEYPFVLKATSGASGDGVKIVECSQDKKDALVQFSSDKFLVVEEYIDIKTNFNVQFSIKANGQINLVGFSEQRVSESGEEYMGNLIDTNVFLPPAVLNIGLNAARVAFEKGYIGLVGFDIVGDELKTYKLIDPNIRPNGSTSTLFLLDKIKAESQSTVFQFGSFESNLVDIQSMLCTALKQDDMYLISGYPKSVGSTYGYGVVCAKSIKHLNDEVKPNLIKKGFKF